MIFILYGFTNGISLLRTSRPSFAHSLIRSPRERKTHELRYRWGLDKEIEDDQEENPSFHADATAEDPVTGETIGIRSSFRNLIALFRVMFVSGFYVLWTVAAGFIILCKLTLRREGVEERG